MAKTQTDLVHPTPKDFFQSLFDALALGNKSQEEYLDQFFPARHRRNPRCCLHGMAANHFYAQFLSIRRLCRYSSAMPMAVLSIIVCKPMVR